MRSARTWIVPTVLAALAAVGRAEDPGGVGDSQVDVAKTLVEMKTERILGGSEREDEGAMPPRAAPVADDAGSRVAPGLVRWHASPAAARDAARASGRPVLVFQMLGRLDDEFC